MRNHLVSGLNDIYVISFSLGHSFGGVIITHLATKIPGRIKRAIYQNAFICADGESLMDMVPQLGQDLYNGLADAHR